MILLFLENGDILVVVLLTLNAVKNPRGHVLSVELRYLEWRYDDGMIIGDCPQEKSQQFWNHDNIYLYLPRLDALKHVLCGVEIVLRLFVRVVQSGFDVDGYYDRLQRWWWWWWRCRCQGVQCSLVFWVILEDRSTDNGGGKAALLWDQADDEMAIAIRWIGKISFNIARKITTSPHSASSRFSAASMSA